MQTCTELCQNKKFLFFLLLWAGIVPANANGIPGQGGKTSPASSGKEASSSYFGGKKILIAYFSWSGNTQRVAPKVQRIAGGRL